MFYTGLSIKSSPSALRLGWTRYREAALGVVLLRDFRLRDHLVQCLHVARSSLDLASGDLFLGYAASLVGPGVNERLRTILQLPGAACRHHYVTKVAVNSILCRHLASCRVGFSPAVRREWRACRAARTRKAPGTGDR